MIVYCTTAHTILAGELVGERVEAEVAGDGEGRHQLGGGHEGVGGRVGVVTPREVTVVRRHDRVLWGR